MGLNLLRLVSLRKGKFRHRHADRIPCDARGRDRSNVATSQGNQGLMPVPEARKGQKSLPYRFQKENDLVDTLFYTPSLHNSERIISVVLSHTHMWYFVMAALEN